MKTIYMVYDNSAGYLDVNGELTTDEHSASRFDEAMLRDIWPTLVVEGLKQVIVELACEDECPLCGCEGVHAGEICPECGHDEDEDDFNLLAELAKQIAAKHPSLTINVDEAHMFIEDGENGETSIHLVMEPSENVRDVNDDTTLGRTMPDVWAEMNRLGYFDLVRSDEDEDEDEDEDGTDEEAIAEAHADASKTELKQRVLELLDEYVNEAEHQDGFGYWGNFADGAEALRDFIMYANASLPDKPEDGSDYDGDWPPGAPKYR